MDRDRRLRSAQDTELRGARTPWLSRPDPGLLLALQDLGDRGGTAFLASDFCLAQVPSSRSLLISLDAFVACLESAPSHVPRGPSRRRVPECAPFAIRKFERQRDMARTDEVAAAALDAVDETEIRAVSLLVVGAQAYQKSCWGNSRIRTDLRHIRRSVCTASADPAIGRFGDHEDAVRGLDEREPRSVVTDLPNIGPPMMSCLACSV